MNLYSCVAVVGGGVFSAVSAFELAQAGRTVVLFERNPIGTHASGRNPANLNPILGTPASLLPLALASFQLHESLHQELTATGFDEYRLEPVRRLLTWSQESEREALESIAKDFLQQPGFAAKWLDAKQALHLEPRLVADVAGGLLIEGNRSLDATAFNRALVAGAQWLVSNAARILPCVNEARVIEHVAALRPMTPKGLPLLGPVPGREGIFLANGGGGTSLPVGDYLVALTGGVRPPVPASQCMTWLSRDGEGWSLESSERTTAALSLPNSPPSDAG